MELRTNLRRTGKEKLKANQDYIGLKIWIRKKLSAGFQKVRLLKFYGTLNLVLLKLNTMAKLVMYLEVDLANKLWYNSYATSALGLRVMYVNCT